MLKKGETGQKQNNTGETQTQNHPVRILDAQENPGLKSSLRVCKAPQISFFMRVRLAGSETASCETGKQLIWF